MVQSYCDRCGEEIQSGDIFSVFDHQCSFYNFCSSCYKDFFFLFKDWLDEKIDYSKVYTWRMDAENEKGFHLHMGRIVPAFTKENKK